MHHNEERGRGEFVREEPRTNAASGTENHAGGTQNFRQSFLTRSPEIAGHSYVQRRAGIAETHPAYR